MVATQVASPNTSTKLPITGDFQIGWQFGVFFLLHASPYYTGGYRIFCEFGKFRSQ
jgi:hypothetical protein